MKFSLLIGLLQLVWINNSIAQKKYDLNGVWVNDGYQCPPGVYHTQSIRITHNLKTGEVAAMKISGNDCVKAGSPTFQGIISKSGFVIEGRFFFGSPDEPSSTEVKTELIIVDNNTIRTIIDQGTYIRVAPKKDSVNLKVEIRDKKTNLPLKADLNLREDSQKEGLNYPGSRSITTKVKIGATYILSGSADGYFADGYQMTIGEEDFRTFLALEPMETSSTPVAETFFQGRVLNSINEEEIDARLVFSTGGQLTSVEYLKNSPFRIKLTGDYEYPLKIIANGFLDQQDNIKVKTGEILNRTYRLEPKSFVFKNVNFDVSDWKILTTSYPELDNLAGMLLARPGTKIRLDGHTDKIGKSEKNKELSEKRVIEVKKYLVAKGVNAQRIQTVGHGDTKPLTQGCSEKNPCPENRRVEFVILEK
ncbi:OmpA family protein [Dyadobacter sp. CY261]|uniref:OmpA family protein n=1 Tax=Dyadobacter sp. CY261 TaxID=2907203 RepID=UPI001F3BA2AB|nr:OmpA family protein [Dyadobacter sp. CY261]MCF0075380.1 OmpA family protein [Dyadobacter sp. CY261]